jgi:hypothetical protein
MTGFENLMRKMRGSSTKVRVRGTGTPAKNLRQQAKQRLRYGTAVGLQSFKARTESHYSYLQVIDEVIGNLDDQYVSAISDLKDLRAQIRAVIALREEVAAPEPGPASLPSMKSAETLLREHQLHRVLKFGQISITGRCSSSVATQKIAKNQITAVAEGPARAIMIGVGGSFWQWFRKQAKAHSHKPTGVEFIYIREHKFYLPIILENGIRSEGRMLDDCVVSAYSGQPFFDEPVKLIHGGPGAGKTHAAIEAMASTGKPFHVFASQEGAREQIGSIGERVGCTKRMKVVSDVKRLRGCPRIVIDEAATVDVDILAVLNKVEQLIVTGDPAQSRLEPGRSLMGLLAALGAPLELLTGSQRSKSWQLAILSDFLRREPPRFPFAGLKRAPSETALLVRGGKPDREIEYLQYWSNLESQKALIITWDTNIADAMRERGYRVLMADQMQGAEADRVVVYLSASLYDDIKYPNLPIQQIVTALCRARFRSILISRHEYVNVNRSSVSTRRSLEIEDFMKNIGHDPRSKDGVQRYFLSNEFTKISEDLYKHYRLMYDRQYDIYRNIYLFYDRFTENYNGAIYIDGYSDEQALQLIRSIGINRIYNLVPTQNEDGKISLKDQETGIYIDSSKENYFKF